MDPKSYKCRNKNKSQYHLEVPTCDLNILKFKKQKLISFGHIIRHNTSESTILEQKEMLNEVQENLEEDGKII